MPDKAEYPGMDRFRMVAALLVVAVHTSPLSGFGAFPDYVLTRVVARLAVPFFFALTGFFLLAPYAEEPRRDTGALQRFLKKTALLYAAAVVLYLPLNLYAGHFEEVASPAAWLRLLLVEGTLYHLWYLPASILGVALTWALLRFLSLPGATALATLLYVLGLLGDSYYGPAASVPALKTLYDGIFTVSPYTRNGLFFAPVFLLAGVWAARKGPYRRGAALAGWLAALALLLAEGVLLYGLPGKRHDSMYILLPLCVFWLVAWLSTFSGPPARWLRQVSLVVYLVHPLVIVLLRGAAKFLGLVPLLVENSLVHYTLVCLFSTLAALAWLWVKGGVARGMQERKTARLG